MLLMVVEVSIISKKNSKAQAQLGEKRICSNNISKIFDWYRDF